MGGQRGLQRGDIHDTWWPSPGESLMALESAGRGLGREQAELAGKDPLHWPAVPGHSPPSGTGVCGLCSGSQSAHQACSPPCHPRPSCAYLARGSTSTALLWASGRLSGTCRLSVHSWTWQGAVPCDGVPHKHAVRPLAVVVTSAIHGPTEKPALSHGGGATPHQREGAPAQATGLTSALGFSLCPDGPTSPRTKSRR